MSGSGLRLVISHPDAALYIQLPMLAMTVAVHSTENVAWPNGLHGEETGAVFGKGSELALTGRRQIAHDIRA
jgi:hypothetical protein